MKSRREEQREFQKELLEVSKKLDGNEIKTEKSTSEITKEIVEKQKKLIIELSKYTKECNETKRISKELEENNRLAKDY